MFHTETIVPLIVVLPMYAIFEIFPRPPSPPQSLPPGTHTSPSWGTVPCAPLVENHCTTSFYLLVQHCVILDHCTLLCGCLLLNAQPQPSVVATPSPPSSAGW